MSTPFERGRAAGAKLWNDERIKECGFHSVQECLTHQERAHQKELENLPRLRATNPEKAAQLAEYLEGQMTGVRESLSGRE